MRWFIILLFLFLLGSCGVNRKVLVVVPVPSKPSSCKYTYKVNGKTYCVRKDARGFVQVGYASWYGPGFHGKRTASGEIYNMYKLTAAHKTLPLGTYVKVINLENGRSVVVKINDRGPFVEGRIIDLSYEAAKRLGMLRKGVAKVKLIALGGVFKSYYKGKFYVQVGAFKNKLNAYSYRIKLIRKYKLPVKVKFMNGYYRVFVGPFSSLEKARSYKKRLKSLGLHSSFIVRL